MAFSKQLSVVVCNKFVLHWQQLFEHVMARGWKNRKRWQVSPFELDTLAGGHEITDRV